MGCEHSSVSLRIFIALVRLHVFLWVGEVVHSRSSIGEIVESVLMAMGWTETHVFTVSGG